MAVGMYGFFVISRSSVQVRQSALSLSTTYDDLKCWKKLQRALSVQSGKATCIPTTRQSRSFQSICSALGWHSGGFSSAAVLAIQACRPLYGGPPPGMHVKLRSHDLVVSSPMKDKRVEGTTDDTDFTD